jgi:hypothetical protein
VSNRLESEVEAAIAETSGPNNAGTVEPGDDAATAPVGSSPDKTESPEESAAVRQSAEARRQETRLKIEEYEGRLGEILTATLGPTHDVTRNARLSVALESTTSPIHDVVAVPRDKRFPAYVFDVKLSSRLFPGRITENAQKRVLKPYDLPHLLARRVHRGKLEDARAREALRHAGNHDDLGMGQLRDVISNSLFPGTSVLHLGARYMLLVPWAYLTAHRGTRNPDELRKRAEESERQLIGRLKELGEEATSAATPAGTCSSFLRRPTGRRCAATGS